MPIRVRFNHLPAVIAAMPRELDDGVDEAADGLALILKSTLWVDTGMIRRVTAVKDESRPMHAAIDVGFYLGKGFYSGFQEFGTHKQAPRPIVLPTAEVFRGRYLEEMGQKVRDACGAE